MERTVEILQGFAERIENILVFSPLLELSQRTKYPYSLPALGLAVMLYIMEDMIRVEKNCTYENIARFLQELIASYYGENLSYQAALDLTHYLVRDGLMNQGRYHSYTYPDWESKGEKTYRFLLVEIDDYEIQSKVVRLRLSTAGLEMLFKTKEMYNELQVSITQLYLRQQIQKGVFDGALRSVEELALAVRNEKQKVRELEERIIRDVLQVAREKEIEAQLRRIDEQLLREQEVFKELAHLVNETLEDLRSGPITPKEERALQAVTKVRRRLHDVIHDHESLFKDKIRIHNLMITTIEQMILTSFATKVNFATEFLRPVVQRKIELDRLRQILDPIFPVQVRPSFNPNRIFLGQPLKRQTEGDTAAEELWRLEEERLREEEAREQAEQLERAYYLRRYAQIVVEPLLEKEQFQIGEVLEGLYNNDKDEYAALTARLDFYSFLVQLHQLGRIPLLSDEEVDTIVLDDIPRVFVNLVTEKPELKELTALEVVATEDVLRLASGYVMTDFLVRRLD